MIPNTEHAAVGQLADQAAQAIRTLNHRTLNHRTRPATADLTDPADTAKIIAALADTAGMLPQLLDQLTHWLQAEQHGGRLRVDTLAPLPDPAQTVHALTGSLQRALQPLRHAAAELDTAHQHAAHLAAAQPTTSHQRSQDSCRSVGPNHLTKRTGCQRTIGSSKSSSQR